jgi:hypothetical protein
MTDSNSIILIALSIIFVYLVFKLYRTNIKFHKKGILFRDKGKLK